MNPRARIQPAQVKLYNVAITSLQKMGVAITKEEMKARFKVTSSKDLTNAQFDEAMQHFAACGFKYRSKGGGPRRRSDPTQRIKQAHLAAISKLLAKLEKDWPYAAGIARQMLSLERVVWHWLSADQLHKVQISLIYELRKQAGDPVVRKPETLAKRGRKTGDRRRETAGHVGQEI